MPQTKPWYLSKTIIGSLLMTLSLLLQTVGVDLTPEDQADLADKIVAAVEVMLGLVGLVMTIIGRIKATRGITLALLMLVFLGGCATMSPSQRYAVTSNAFSATVEEVAVLIELGVIPEEQFDDIQTTAHAIDTELDALDAAITNGIPLDYQFVLARVERLLGQLVQYQLDGQGVTHGPGSSDGDGYGWHEGVHVDSRTGRAGEAGGTRPDSRGDGGDSAEAGPGDEFAGQGDRVASRLRELYRRHAGLTRLAVAQ